MRIFKNWCAPSILHTKPNNIFVYTADVMECMKAKFYFLNWSIKLETLDSHILGEYITGFFITSIWLKAFSCCINPKSQEERFQFRDFRQSLIMTFVNGQSNYRHVCQFYCPIFHNVTDLEESIQSCPPAGYFRYFWIFSIIKIIFEFFIKLIWLGVGF